MTFAGVTGTQGFWLRKCLKSSAHDKVTLCQGLGTIYVLCYEDTCFPQTNMPFISQWGGSIPFQCLMLYPPPYQILAARIILYEKLPYV